MLSFVLYRLFTTQFICAILYKWSFSVNKEIIIISIGGIIIQVNNNNPRITEEIQWYLKKFERVSSNKLKAKRICFEVDDYITLKYNRGILNLFT
jgi:hypothetical protein